MMEYYKQFAKHLESNDLSSISNLWEEYCLSDEVDLDEVIRILTSIQNSHISESFGSCVEQFLPLWESLPDSKKGREIFRLITDMQTSNDDSLRAQILDRLTTWYGDHPRFDQKIKLCGLNHTEFRYSFSRFELLSHMERGNFVFHNAGWGVGEIMDVSLIREQISCEFDFVAGCKDLSFANAFKTLIPLPKDHFLALRFGNPDALEEKTRANPVETIRILLRDLGPKTASEIKEELAELVIPEEEWGKWWQTARSKLKKDTLIEVPSSMRKPFRIRDAEVTHEDRLQSALKQKPTANKLIDLIYNYTRDFSTTLKNEEFKQSIIRHLIEILKHEELTDAQALQIHYFLEDLMEGRDHDPVVDLIKGLSSIEALVNDINIIAHKKRTLAEIKLHRDGWEAVFGELLLTTTQTTLKEYIFEQLLAAGNLSLIESKLEQLLLDPAKYPHALIWYFQKAVHTKGLPLSDQEGNNRLLDAFFALFHTLESGGSHRDLVKKMHGILTSGRFATIRHIFKGADKNAVIEFLLLATKSHSLSEHEIKILHSLAEVVHPSLAGLNKKYSSTEDEEEIIWTTEEGLQKIKERLHHIGTVETVENAKEVEIARSHGDLRENSEYKYACERRSQLQNELKRLSKVVDAMRVLSVHDINTEQVNVGNIVHLKTDDGKTLSYTILGPWDAVPEKNILSFESKLAQSLIGKSIGDTCEIQEKSWTVTEIENYLQKI